MAEIICRRHRRGDAGERAERRGDGMCMDDMMNRDADMANGLDDRPCDLLGRHKSPPAMPRQRFTVSKERHSDTRNSKFLDSPSILPVSRRFPRTRIQSWRIGGYAIDKRLLNVYPFKDFFGVALWPCVSLILPKNIRKQHKEMPGSPDSAGKSRA